MDIVIADIHFGVRNDSQFYLKKTVDFFDKMMKFVYEKEVERIFVLGDFVDDRRELNISTMCYITSLLDEFERAHSKFGMRVIYTLGNHDLYYKHETSVNALVPLLNRYSHAVYSEDPFCESNYVIVPWITSNNAESVSKFLKNVTDKRDKIVLGHFDFSELVPFKNGGDIIDFKILKNFKRVLSGHYHLRTSKSNFQYVGSVLDYQWGEEQSPHGFMVISGEESFYVDNDDSIHKKFLISSKEDLKSACDESEGKSVKIILSKSLDITNREYEYYISSIDKKSHDMQVFMENEIFIDSTGTEDIKIKSFDEFLEEFFKNKSFGLNVDNSKLMKIFMALYRLAEE